MTSRTEKLRRRQHRKEKKRRRAGTTSSNLAPSTGRVMVEPPRAAKMSEVLLELVQPGWHACADEEAMRKLLTLGIAAWNAALMTGAARTALVEKLARTFPVESREDFHQVIEPLIRRKEELFPDLQRPMLNFELTRLPSGDMYVQVLSGLA